MQVKQGCHHLITPGAIFMFIPGARAAENSLVTYRIFWLVAMAKSPRRKSWHGFEEVIALFFQGKHTN